jgi:hypothetical protein
MNAQILAAWNEKQSKVREWLATTDQSTHSYESLLKNTLRILFENEGGAIPQGLPNHDLITEIDHGDYQGTLVFVIGGSGYQPGVEDHWYTSVYYGSCSGCDTLQGISDYPSEKLPSEDQVQEYWTLCLHMIQKMKRMTKEETNV